MCKTQKGRCARKSLKNFHRGGIHTPWAIEMLQYFIMDGTLFKFGKCEKMVPVNFQKNCLFTMNTPCFLLENVK